MIRSLLLLLFALFVFSSVDIRAEENNKIIVCDNGLEMFAWDLEFIRHATQSIDLAACFFGGSTAQEILTEIEARLEVCPDIQVSILASPAFVEKENYEMIDRLTERYPQNFRVVFSKIMTIIWPDVTGIDNHVKMCVIDEHYFSMGGTNLEDGQCSDGTYTPDRKKSDLNFMVSSLAAGMRDQDIVGRGPIAKQLRNTFCKLIALWEHYEKTARLERDPEAFRDNTFYFPILEKPFVEQFEQSDACIELKTSQMKHIISGPYEKQNPITDEYIRLINAAQTEIKIANLYMFPADDLLKALLNAVNRGVRLTVITNGISDISPDYNQYFCWANRLSYVPFFFGRNYHFWDYWFVKKKEKNQTRIFEYHVEDIILHKKMMIVDDRYFVLGSYNFGVKSHTADYEMIMVIDSPKVVQAVNKVHERDLEHSREITSEEAIEWYFDPFTSYLGELQRRFHGLI